MNAYEIYAIKYAHHERTASANFLGGDPHDGPPRAPSYSEAFRDGVSTVT